MTLVSGALGDAAYSYALDDGPWSWTEVCNIRRDMVVLAHAPFVYGVQAHLETQTKNCTDYIWTASIFRVHFVSASRTIQQKPRNC